MKWSQNDDILTQGYSINRNYEIKSWKWQVEKNSKSKLRFKSQNYNLKKQNYDILSQSYSINQNYDSWNYYSHNWLFDNFEC